MKGLRVAVLRGGPSEEYNVSMQTGLEVQKALLAHNITTFDIIVTRQGDWLVDGFHKTPQAALAATDVVFLALHGAYGEDGTVQRILDRIGIPYTGSRAYPSAVAMNKSLTKEQLRDLGIKMPPHLRVTRDGSDIFRMASNIESLFGPEYIVKPVGGGSSFGIYMANGVASLARALKLALEEREEVLVEKRIRGREATAGVIERFRGQDFYSLPVVEIIPPATSDFFAADVKYDGSTEEICPGRFSRQEKKELEIAALKVHQKLNLSQYSRSDFIVADDGVYFLEVNTLPGLTSESLLPKALQAVGCEYKDFVKHLVRDALNVK